MKEFKNILFITSDQWRGECLSYTGHPLVETPALDSLAEDGVYFIRHYAQCTNCGPSRASLYTGMYLQNHRSVTNGAPLDSRHTNIALELRKKGYTPWLIGYTDTSPDPREYPDNDPILKSWEGFLNGYIPAFNKYTDGLPVTWIEYLEENGYKIPDNPLDIFNPVSDYPDAENKGKTYPPPYFNKNQSDTAYMTDVAMRYIRTQKENPWFITVNYRSPHPPYAAAEPYNTLYKAEDVPDFAQASSIDEEGKVHPYLAYLLEQNPLDCDWGSYRYPRDDFNMKQLKATYYGMMTETDYHIGRIIDYLKDTGLYDKTLIIFTSDHGEMLWDHYLQGKGSYFDQNFYIPLIMRVPGEDFNKSRGMTVNNFTESIDIMPTILELTNQEIPIQCDGSSLIPFLKGGKPDKWRTEAHWELDFRDVETGLPEKELGLRLNECCLGVIRDEKYKYVHFAALPPLLFDIENDPDELVNLYGDPAYNDIALEYAQKMLSWRMKNDERTLTGMIVGNKGLITRPFSDW